MGEMGNAYKILVRKSERKRPPWRLKNRWEDNIKLDLKNRICGVDCIYLAKDKLQWPFLVNTVMNIQVP